MENNSDAPLGETRWATLPPTANSEWSTLALQFIPEREHSYSEFVNQILHTVCVWDGPDSKLDVTIHFRKRHFELEPNYKFDVCAMDALGVEGPGVKSLYLFLPAIQEKNVLVSPCVISQDFSTLIP